MEKRMLLALALSMVVVVVFSHLQAPPEDAEVSKQPQQQEVTEADTQPKIVKDSPGESKSTSKSPSFEGTQLIDPGETVPFETPKLTGYFSAAGGRLASIKLKNFTLLDDKSKLYQLAGKHKRGLGFESAFPEIQLAKQNFKQISHPDTEVFIFKSQTEKGVTLRKKYNLVPNKDYQVKLTVSLHNETDNPALLNNIRFPVGPQGRGGAALNWGPGFGITRENESRFDRTYWYYGKEGAMEYFSPGGGSGFFGFFGGNDEDIDGQFARGPVDWTAISDRYFIAGIAPDRPFDMIYLDDRAETGAFTTWSAYSNISLQPAETMEFNYDMFLGPKDYNTLNEFHPGMEQTLNYGWFTILVRPLLWGLESIYSVIPNYGFAIIILSIIIKMLLYPLTKKGLTSMQKMKELQPEIKKIQEKYEDDKEKLNKEMMKFYQEHDLNPVGGCLPMLLQLPIFIGLYRMLQYNVNLRGAPFIFWITDLSSRDPYYILPVLMGIIMFAQQYYTMSAGSSGGAMGQQKTMAYVMPVVFVFMFMTFPVGLVLYWMTNSAATLVQYWLIYRSTE